MKEKSQQKTSTMEYAQNELKKYYKAVTGEEDCEIELINLSEGNKFDDSFEIKVECGKGYIKGSNERAVLIGVYKLFYELGCRFIRPGKEGEIIVKRAVSDFTVNKTYRAQNRYRGVCNEGAISEENIVDMVEWLPKIGMNSYFIQFVDGHLFFEKWYKHKDSSVMKPEVYSIECSKQHYENAVKAIKRCGLIFQAVGHGWTTDPFGFVTFGENHSVDSEIKPEQRELFAEVKGKRGFFQNSPSDSHLCYSKPEARAIVTDAIVSYLKGHPDVDILHFWLADGINNHCECEKCREMLPSEWYVMMLNELDEKLTKEKIDTKIAFLIYCDLLFAPKKVSIQNTDRYIMMFAPIARNFYEAMYSDKNIEANEPHAEFIRNCLSHPKSNAQALSFLKEWRGGPKNKFDGFAFDYHLMTFLYEKEPSFTRISRTYYEDMGALDKVGLNGNVSCQLQRVFLPTSLPMYVMAERLFGSTRTFDEIENECLESSFGRQTEKVKGLLHETEEFYLKPFMRGEANIIDFDEDIKAYIESLNEYEKAIEFSDENAVYNVSLKNIKYFIETQKKTMDVIVKMSDYLKEKKRLMTHIDANEMEVQPYEDSYFKKMMIESMFERLH